MEEYSYILPPEQIARYPLEKRDSSKLLIYMKGKITMGIFPQIVDLIPPYSLLVKNNTRVIQARLLFKKDSGARIEIFCLEPESPSDYESNFLSKGSVSWKCLIGNSKKWKSGSLSLQLNIDNTTVVLNAERLPVKNGDEIVRFSWEPPHYCFSELLSTAGLMPIPPYLNRQAVEKDRDWYQTVYAQYQGSVAAPTAGLHFSDKVLDALKSQNTQMAELTLHVGAGTFTPVKEDNIANHRMHTEHVHITRDLIHDLLNLADRGITAVGTTSLRALESLYWFGYLLHKKRIRLDQTVEIDQWLPYQSDSKLTARASLLGILIEMNSTRIEEINFLTRIIIVPGYTFRVVDQLITNFHQPNSTLLLLVAAFVGEQWKNIYKFALDNNFRFLSYGDSSILRRNDAPFKDHD